LNALAERGALFFGEIVQRAGLLQAQVEQALGELAAQGWVTSDSFEGVRALLVPQGKRAPFGDLARKRHSRAATGIEFAGRWSRLRKMPASNEEPKTETRPSEAAMEAFARVLLRRYGVVFRRLLERESLPVSWFELGRVYRRLEARGEIRGGYFVNGVSGGQFALPEAIGTLRSLRKVEAPNELITLNAADPLNLVGILTPGARIPATLNNRILMRDGAPLAALDGGKVVILDATHGLPENELERALKVGRLPASLRPYYR
jgi:ATP-dependent Lhr-like helicase